MANCGLKKIVCVYAAWPSLTCVTEWCITAAPAHRTVVFFSFCIFLIWNTKRLAKMVGAANVC